MASHTRTPREGGRGRNGNRLAEAYFAWLVEQVREQAEHPRRTYWDVLRLMHDKEFIWIPNVGNDDNRIYDGRELRWEFLSHRGVDFDPAGPGGASCLEVMIGISRRMEFNAGESAEGWAWLLLCNLGLHRMPDPVSRRKLAQADDILDALIYRNYQPDGTGSFFPLAWPPDDMRKVEVWYQMHAYILEIHPEY
jgi:hypothetical protein